MRVIAGEFKGRTLFSPKDRLIRPTSDRVREFIFSVIGESIRGAAVLDLFCGTGALGLEAKSRGAANIVFVDCSRNALELVRRNCSLLKVEASILKGDAISVLSTMPASTFDYIFCDPPYDYEQPSLLLQTIKETGRLSPEGLLIYESSWRRPIPEAAGWTALRSRKLGETCVTFFFRD